ncbi:hypothetical protein H4219_003947 [Mycoemilia scoparia]|uniref:Uncharacterized protein n=1 Tax=Mycoemilia scoparia TaxID=417184 RepID=A0A9W8DNK4_9FUNG|nr:hypothetical protein H4219_003947 [Mycoemilia scoparia]
MNQPEERTNASRELPFQRLRDFRENGGTISNTPYTKMIEYNNQRNFNMEFINHSYKYLCLSDKIHELEVFGVMVCICQLIYEYEDGFRTMHKQCVTDGYYRGLANTVVSKGTEIYYISHYHPLYIKDNIKKKDYVYGKIYMMAATALWSNKSVRYIQGSVCFGTKMTLFAATKTEDGGIVIYPDEDEYDMNDPKIPRIMYSFKEKYQDNIQDDNDSETRD